jgi:hypothetical protein
VHTSTNTFQLTHAFEHRTYNIQNKCIPFQDINLEPITHSLSSILQPYLLKHHHINEYRRSTIRRLYLQRNFAEKALRFLSQNSCDRVISRQDILNQCPYDSTLTTFSKLLQERGCAVQGYNEFHLICEASGIYEFVTRDFTDRLARYIRNSNFSHKTILEVGAGGGVMARSLKSRLDSSSRYVATDLFSSSSSSSNGVLKMDYRRALEIFRPSLVLVSWMPRNKDWTRVFRDAPYVKEYLMIGDPSLCGTLDSWKECDMFSSSVLDDVSSVQLCRYDEFDNKNVARFRSRSITMSFKRHC